MNKQKKIVCLGGGIGTVNLILGLQQYTHDITTVVSMADDGGSAGRLRRLYNTYPFGDLVSCMSALAQKDIHVLPTLLTHRLPGSRYGKDSELGGHKVGNLILLALYQITGNLDTAIEKFKELFGIEGTFLPATKEPIVLSALTTSGKEIIGEEKIDLGKYIGKKELDKVRLHPTDPEANPHVIEAIDTADALIFGPGDLYTNILPVMIVPEIAEVLKTTKAKKFYVVNVANKPFETRGYTVNDFISAITKHIDCFPFDYVLINNNFSTPIPKEYRYTYVKYNKNALPQGITFIEEDLVNKAFPLYHNCNQLAKVAFEQI